MTTQPLSTETTAEREDLVAALAEAREFLRHTVRGLTDEQARLRPTDSKLCLGGLIKHVAAMEAQWVRFIVDGPSPADDVDGWDSPRIAEFQATFTFVDESLEEVLAEYARVAERTDRAVRELSDLNATHPLPKAPWSEGGIWSHRRTLLHILAETTQHSGHADIIRESIDGQKTMG
jgi:uncharacterized damage-inducible protein DinB